MVDKDAVHREALEKFSQVQNGERNQRILATEDLKFCHDESGQWDDIALERRKGRPCYTINRVAGAVSQLIGDYRQNRTDITILPAEKGDDELASVFTGLIRNIESGLDSVNAYDSAFQEMVVGGYGGWRIVTEFEDDGFDQEIKIKPIINATSSLWFGPSETVTKHDAKWAFLTVDMPRSEYELKFPKASISDFSQEKLAYMQSCGWIDGAGDTVKVAEYWVKEPATKTIGLMSDGRVLNLDEESQILDELAADGITLIKQRKVASHNVVMYLMNGVEVIEGPMAWAGKYIPLIPVYGHTAVIEKQTYHRGIVRFAKDANRIYNYATSMQIETSALTPKDPYWYTPAMVEGHESKYRTFNTSNSPFMPYNPDPNTGGGPPIRSGSPSVQDAFIHQVNQASMDLYHTTGMQPPSMGINPELKSGKAIIAQEKLGDRGSYIYTDNIAKSREHAAYCLLDLIPKIYDTERQIQVQLQDGVTESHIINQKVVDEQTGDEVIVNDLSLGKYRITINVGPSFNTQREESAEKLLELIQASPAFESIAMDLIAQDLPVLQSKELTARIRRQMIMNGVIEPTEDEVEKYNLNAEQPVDPQQQALNDNINMQTEKLISDIEKNDAQTDKTMIEARNKIIEGYHKYMDSLKVEDEIVDITQTDATILEEQQDAILRGFNPPAPIDQQDS